MQIRDSRRLKAEAAPALTVVYRNPADLKPDPRNARVHSPEQIAQLRAMMDELGVFTNPILLRDDETTIGAGHGRQAASLLDPPLESVPTITIRGLTEEQWRAYAIADNQLALNSGWDEAILRAELEALGQTDIDLGLLGFSELELASLTLERQDGENDPYAEWLGMPAFDQQDKTAHRSLLIHFADDAAVAAFAKLLGQKISEKTKSLWHPAAEIERTSDKRYVEA